MKPRVLRRRLAIEANVVLAGAMLAVKAASAQRVTAWAARPPRRIHRFADPDWPALVADSVMRAAAQLRPANPCLPCALAAQFMLRRRGIASRLCLGVRKSEGSLSAHAWIEVDGKMIIGETGESFTRLAEYGQASPVRTQP